MKMSISSDMSIVRQAFLTSSKQATYAAMVALNATAEKGRVAVVKEMRSVFDRPTPWVLNSLRIKYASRTKLMAELAHKDRNSAESSRSMVAPHVTGGERHFKAMEARLLGTGLIPKGYNAVPGGAAKLNANGNMSPGQITQVLNVLGTYTEAGYNKANSKTVTRLAKGRVKKNIYGFVYWVNPVSGPGRQRHLQPGVYQRVTTGFGSSLKPILIFVRQARYRPRLDFFGIAQTTVDKEFPAEFGKAFSAAMATATPSN
ncbi:MAG: hypothetical protein Q7U05_01080 [Polaromonas sp.]|nr:hypothetical protein [Polaromonas sp.]